MSAAGSDTEAILARADSAYNAKDYRSALSLYKRVQELDGNSAQLWHNIGNACFRLGDNGQAVLAYERALRLDPSDENARASLKYVNSTIKGLPDDGTTFLSNIHNSVRTWFSPDGWAVTAGVIFLVILGGVATYLFVSNVTVRKIGFFGSIVLVFVFAYALTQAWQTAAAPDNHDQLVVTSSGARLTTKPQPASSKDDKAVTVPAGAKLNIIDSVSTPDDPTAKVWYNIRLSNANEAWISGADVERI